VRSEWLVKVTNRSDRPAAGLYLKFKSHSGSLVDSWYRDARISNAGNYEVLVAPGPDGSDVRLTCDAMVYLFLAELRLPPAVQPA
jgi:hypothetical protein